MSTNIRRRVHVFGEVLQATEMTDGKQHAAPTHARETAWTRRRLVKYAETSGRTGSGARVFRSWENSRQFESFTRLADTVMDGDKIFAVCHQPAGTNKISPAPSSSSMRVACANSGNFSRSGFSRSTCDWLPRAYRNGVWSGANSVYFLTP